MSNNLVHVRHGNVFLDISPESVEKYMAKGFDIVDEYGNVIKECIPSDVNSLKAAYNKHVAQIAELEKQIKELNQIIVDLKKIPAPKSEINQGAESEEKLAGKSPRKSKKSN